MSFGKHLIAYSSPAGSTEKVGSTIGEKLEQLGETVYYLDLSSSAWKEKASPVLDKDTSSSMIWIGSPVYAQHAVPPVREFLDWLPYSSERQGAVPIVTWGAVCSGIALFEMGRSLEEKGYGLLGAAKILSEHSSMWRSNSPLGGGHPDETDLEKVRQLAERVQNSIKQGAKFPISSQDLDYQPAWIRREAENIDLQKVKSFHPGYPVDNEVCTQCGVCADNCPAGAITLNPFPEIGENCFLCNNCVRLCPEGAIYFDTDTVENRVREMEQRFQEEEKKSEIF